MILVLLPLPVSWRQTLLKAVEQKHGGGGRILGRNAKQSGRRLLPTKVKKNLLASPWRVQICVVPEIRHGAGASKWSLLLEAGTRKNTTPRREGRREGVRTLSSANGHTRHDTTRHDTPFRFSFLFFNRSPCKLMQRGGRHECPAINHTRCGGRRSAGRGLLLAVAGRGWMTSLRRLMARQGPLPERSAGHVIAVPADVQCVYEYSPCMHAPELMSIYIRDCSEERGRQLLHRRTCVCVARTHAADVLHGSIKPWNRAFRPGMSGSPLESRVGWCMGGRKTRQTYRTRQATDEDGTGTQAAVRLDSRASAPAPAHHR